MKNNVLGLVLITSLSLTARAQQVATEAVPAAQAGSQSQVTNVVVESAAAAVAQPTTVVEASPLVVSKAEEMRTARQRAEVETEQRIVEKLEAARLEDEQRRLGQLLGDKNNQQQTQQVQQAVQQPQVIQVIAVPAPTAAPQVQAVQAPVVQQAASQSEAAKTETPIKDLVILSDVRNKYTFSGLLGLVSYDAPNVTDEAGYGFEVGWYMNNRFMVDFSFLYSRHFIEDINYNFQRMEQFGWSGDLKYAILPNRVSPTIGAVLTYNYRQYSRPYSFDNRQTSSDALDVGFVVGVNFEVSRKFALSVDYRLMMNLDTNYDSDLLNRASYGNIPGFTPIEELDYDVLLFNAKYIF